MIRNISTFFLYVFFRNLWSWPMSKFASYKKPVQPFRRILQFYLSHFPTPNYSLLSGNYSFYWISRRKPFCEATYIYIRSQLGYVKVNCLIKLGRLHWFFYLWFCPSKLHLFPKKLYLFSVVSVSHCLFCSCLFYLLILFYKSCHYFWLLLNVSFSHVLHYCLKNIWQVNSCRLFKYGLFWKLKSQCIWSW